MKATISKRKEIAKGTLMVEFKLEKNINFKAGQYFFIKLPKLLYPDDKGEERHFSIVNPPNEKGIIRMATRITGSGFKRTLEKMKLGTELEIFGITGDFVLPKEHKKPVVCIAGGIGITPFMSMLSFVNEENLDYDITLLYSNRNKASTAFFREIVEMTMKNTKIHVIFTMNDDSEWHGESSKVDAELIKKYFPKYHDNIYMIAGPPQMVSAVSDELIKLKINKKNIITENFLGY